MEHRGICTGGGEYKITLRKEKLQPYLDNEFLAGLNYYFGNLCNDENYVKPVPLKENPETHPHLELQEFDVMITLSKIKKTATGPDGLPFWVWRDNCTTQAPVVTALCNKSLSSYTWPTAWKEAPFKGRHSCSIFGFSVN